MKTIIQIITLLLSSLSVFGQQDTSCYLEFKRIRDRYLELDNYRMELQYLMKGGNLPDNSGLQSVVVTRSGDKQHLIMETVEIVSNSDGVLTVNHQAKTMLLGKPQKEQRMLMEGMTSGVFEGYTKEIKCQKLAGGYSQLSFKVKGAMVQHAVITYDPKDYRIISVKLTYQNGYGYYGDEGVEPVVVEVKYLSEKQGVSFSGNEFDMTVFCTKNSGKIKTSEAYRDYVITDATN